MKRLWYISALVIPLILVGFFISCDTAGGLSGYYIYALLDDTEYEWKLGLTNIVDDAFGFVQTDIVDSTVLFATPDVETGAAEPDNYVWIEFEGKKTGTFSMSDVINTGYTINGVEWDFTDITLVVTVYEDVGGVIQGTFTGTIEESGDTNTMTVENGQFNVIRVEDNASPTSLNSLL
jgi:hypothetical protein